MASNNRRKPHLERACAWCGKVFWPFHDSQRCCSQSCGAHARSPHVQLICPQCDSPFTAQANEVAHGRRLCGKRCADAAMSKSPEATFWASFQKTDACWLWTGDLGKDGYGIFNAGHHKYRGHVYSYTLHHGPIPDGLYVLHHCDTPPCVNPDHLFTGTAADNAADKVAKGRQQRGQGICWAKMTEDRVRQMRAERAAGMTLKALGARYGLNHSTVADICLRKTWRHVE